MQSKEKINKFLNLIMRTWRRFRLAVPRTRSLTTSCTMMPLINLRRSRSWPDNDLDNLAPEGCLAVYVGPDHARFVIKAESINHPLFRKPLEEAEKEYGFDFAGPLTLPCEVSVFSGILDTLNIDYGVGEGSLSGDDVRLGLPSGRALNGLK